MTELVDLRSDTVTRPTAGMRRAMADAEVGDDVYGEDPTVRALEREVADRFGRQAAVLTPSGVMATQILLRALTTPGSEVVCESDAHIVAYEAGAAAINAQVQFRTVDGDRGRLDADTVRAALRPAAFPYTEVAAISVEETTNRGGGAIHGLERLRALRAIADERGLALHGDGARLWHALVATGQDPTEVGRTFTAFSVCLSKGLGAPVGSLAIGDADTIEVARAWRRRFGGAMRQAGVLAAAGRYALEHHLDRLADDHANARHLATRLAEAVPDAVDLGEVETNLVYVRTGGRPAGEVIEVLAARGIRIGAMGPHLLRAVTHLDVDRDGIDRAVDALIAELTP
ncbi:MAG: GntG family PLP-dependent aldolase [Nitriliruptor sp.]|uniref:low specificity L-threonine aldolase n=1 Tax=Nitriliruptor sp. TaxID=2448056 RepID=UPI0034A00954